MDYRYNEIIIWMIPGLYLMCLGFGIIVYPIVGNVSLDSLKEFFDVIPDGVLTTTALFFIPFISLVLGYLINYLASQLEYWGYQSGFKKRASYVILTGESTRYTVADFRGLRKKLGCQEQKLTNATANKYFIKAKQSIELSSLENYYFKTVFGRNILCSQVIITILTIVLYFVGLSISQWLIMIMSLMTFLFYLSWDRNNKVYVKYIFSSYLNLH